MREGEADPGLYDFRPYRDRHPIRWPDGKTVAVWVSPNIEFYEIDPPANPHRKSWARPHPDVVGYGHRDYGNRVGHFRLADVMAKHGFPGSVSLSVAMCQHHPEIVAHADSLGWEFFSHGIYNTRYSYNLTEAQERAIIQDAIDTVMKATGKRVRGYLAPALTMTERTLDLIGEYDFWYTCDLFQDDQPQPLKTRTGKLLSVPYALETNDVITYAVQGMDPWRYADMVKRHFDQLLEEGARSGTVMCIPLHAYLVAHPNRIRAFDDALKHIDAHKADVWTTTGAEIAQHYRENYWDQTIADIADRGFATQGTGFSHVAA
jgi:peptidoglycan/xylan/chitin deacetylase (PgdA/CDA1 family)